MRLKLICCERFCIEMVAVISRSVNQVDPQFLSRAVPPRGCKQMRPALQAALDGVDESAYHGILLAYGMGDCSVLGLRARTIPLVLPRVEDCSVLLGGHQAHPCTFERPAAGPVVPPRVDSLLRGDRAERLEFEAGLEAVWFGWDFERARANLGLLQRFVDGFWSHHEFLVVPPGYQVTAARNEEIIRAEECPT